MANAIGARAYKECSALKVEGVDDVFETATRASMLMRDGVPSQFNEHLTHHHHKRKSSGGRGPEENKNWGCCVVC